MSTFKIGINMAGAVSAGAYTAGVLDFLTEALDEWYKAKARGEAVPRHDASIEVFSGASAGGICAAVSALLLHEQYEHIHDASKANTTNRLYECWVNRIDIRELLKTDDLKDAKSVTSLLDCTILDTIATYALKPVNLLPAPPPYLAPSLTLFLSLTNLRGTPYSLNGAAPGSIEETTFFYGDRIRFETCRLPEPSSSTTALHAASPVTLLSGSTHTLDLNRPGAPGGWDVLETAAKATAAFPLFLAPRVLHRCVSEYLPPHWEPLASQLAGTPAPVRPNFPPGFAEPFSTLNVDGGVTNNDPFNYAHDYLSQCAPASPDGHNPRHAKDADRAVITVAPFPPIDPFEPDYDPKASASIFAALPKLFGALISQARFFGESLSDVMTGETFSRFIIAPSDPEPGASAAVVSAVGVKGAKEPPPALECALLGAFGGFFKREFRAHDFLLGRRNCQKFLMESFVLPVDNPVIASGLDTLAPTQREAVLAKYSCAPPGSYAHTAGQLQDQGRGLPHAQQGASPVWLPIIPLCSPSVCDEAPRPQRSKIRGKELDEILDLILKRYKAVFPLLIAKLPSMLLRIFLRLGQPAIRLLARGALRDALVKQFGEAYLP